MFEYLILIFLLLLITFDHYITFILTTYLWTQTAFVIHYPLTKCMTTQSLPYSHSSFTYVAPTLISPVLIKSLHVVQPVLSRFHHKRLRIASECRIKRPELQPSSTTQ